VSWYVTLSLAEVAWSSVGNWKRGVCCETEPHTKQSLVSWWWLSSVSTATIGCWHWRQYHGMYRWHWWWHSKSPENCELWPHYRTETPPPP